MLKNYRLITIVIISITLIILLDLGKTFALIDTTRDSLQAYDIKRAKALFTELTLARQTADVPSTTNRLKKLFSNGDLMAVMLFDRNQRVITAAYANILLTATPNEPDVLHRLDAKFSADPRYHYLRKQMLQPTNQAVDSVLLGAGHEYAMLTQRTDRGVSSLVISLQRVNILIRDMNHKSYMMLLLTLPIAFFLYFVLRSAKDAIGQVGAYIDSMKAAVDHQRPQLNAVVRLLPKDYRELVIGANALAEIRLEKLNREKAQMDQLLSTTSHELKQPLSAILGFTEDLLVEAHRPAPNVEKLQHDLEVVARNAQNLKRTTDNLLNHKQIQRQGAICAEAESEFFLENVIRDTVSACKYILKQKRISLRGCIRVDGHDTLFDESGHFNGVQLRVRTVEKALYEILLNLLANAAKFTPVSGLISLQLILQETLTLTIEDSGPGIPEDERQRVMDAYIQLKDTGGNNPGVGLGLSIAAYSVNRLKGGIRISQSDLFGGAKITADIRRIRYEQVETCATPTQTNTDMRQFQGQTALVVEDNPDNREVSRRALQDIGLNVIDFESGESMLETLQYLRFDIVLLDQQLGSDHLTGLEIAKLLRIVHPDTPILLLTADITIAADHAVDEIVQKSGKFVITNAVRRCLTLRQSATASNLPENDTDVAVLDNNAS